jgi:hypothetical protein
MPKVPLLGEVPKGGLLAGGLSVVAVGGYLWYKHQKNAAVPSSASYAYGYGSGEAAGYYGYGQYGYGDSMGSGLVNPYPTGSEYGYGAYGYGYYNPYTGSYLGGGTGSGVGVPPTGSTAPTTNLQWVKQANSGLGGGKTTALLRYIGGLPLNSGQQTSVREAIGLMGNPPVAGANGYPPSWHAAPSGGQNTSHTITANGHETLWQIAHAHHDSEAKVIRLNPKLAHFAGSKKNIPRGTKVKV